MRWERGGEDGGFGSCPASQDGPVRALAHDADHLVLVHRVLGRELSGPNDGVRYRYVEPYERTRDVPELRPPVRDARVSDPSETGCERVLKGVPVQ